LHPESIWFYQSTVPSDFSWEGLKNS